MKKNLAFKVLLLLAAVLVNCSLFSQDLILKGKIFDERSKESIPYTNISVQRFPLYRLFKGTISDMDGSFSIQLPQGKYRLKIAVIGFEEKLINDIELKSDALDLGKIFLTPKVFELGEVNITANRSYIENKPGKQILNVGRDIAGGGGNISQILKIVPSIEVTPRGDVSIRGNENIKILINGKEMTYGIDPAILLKQLPSSTVEKIEVVTNASVNEDPESAGGAINIVLRKNTLDGFHYGINLEAGMEPFRGNGGFTMNYAQGKLNTYLTYGAYVDNYNFSNSGQRKITHPSSMIKSISDNGTGKYKDLGHLILGGIDYDLSEKTVLNIEFTHNRYKEDWEYELDNIYERKQGSKLNGFTRNINKEKIRFSDISARIESSPKENHKFTSLLHISGGNQNNNRKIFEEGSYFNEQTQSDINSTAKFIIGELKAGYKMPVSKNGDFEFGINSELVDYNANQIGIGSYADNKEWDYDQQKHAAYLMYKHKIGKFSFGVGSRAEYYKSNTLEKIDDDLIEQKHTKIYPNLILNYNLGNPKRVQNISLSYSKRIRRPEAEELDPVIDYADPSHIHQGNPHLKPEFINSVELAYNLVKGSSRINLTLFGRETNHVIQQQTLLREGGILYTTYQNHSSSKSIGIELNSKVKPLRQWETSLGASLMKSSFAEPNQNQNVYHKDGSMWQLKWNNFIKLNPKNTLQLQIQYYGKTVGMYYIRKPYNVVNLGFEHQIFNGMGTLGFSINDAFNRGGKEHYMVIGQGFESNSQWKLDSRNFKVSFGFYLN